MGQLLGYLLYLIYSWVYYLLIIVINGLAILYVFPLLAITFVKFMINGDVT